MKQYVYKYRDNKEAGSIRLLKPEVNFNEYIERQKEKGFQVIKTKKPSYNTLEKWVDNGVAKSVDGCRVELDGSCSHGFPSLVRVLGLV